MRTKKPQTNSEIKKDLLQQILKFYNDKGNWLPSSSGFSTIHEPHKCALDKDNGELAGLGSKLISAKEEDVYVLAETIRQKLDATRIGLNR